MKSVRIGNGQGFWGDSIDAPVALLRGGPIDYITLDYLAEVTLSIMQRQRMKDPSLGYALDFVSFIDAVLPELMTRKVRVIANAGGVNPAACQQALLEVARKHGVMGLRIGIVTGDDILDRLGSLAAQGERLCHMETGEALDPATKKVLSANVYMPTLGIAQALDRGAHIVITGRCTDPGLVLGPLMHEFGWREPDQLALGTVAGHILECGAQACGGNFTDWEQVPDLEHIGYPIAEVSEDGTVVITKHEGTGGMVTTATVAEQLLYEMGDPTSYITPDCIADFTSIRLQPAGSDRVAVSGVRGRAATEFLKVSCAWHDGYKAAGQLTVCGPKARAKAAKCAQIAWARLQRSGYQFEESLSELLGTGVCHAGMLGGDFDPPEVVLRLAVKDHRRDAVERFCKELAPLVTSGPPGVTGFAGGRPKPAEIVAYWPALLRRQCVEQQVAVVEV